MSDRKRSLRGTLIGGTFSIALLVAAGFLFLNQQYVKDQVVVWGYSPSSNITAIENRIDLTQSGTFHFRATQPKVASSDTFNQDCPRQETASPILGCYTSDHRIYIYDITNQQLDGLEEVTAAHEMLHAAWQRMSMNEQTRVGALLKTEYQKHTNDASLVERMEYYQRTEPGEFENELHSILGTEIEALSPELETYYGQYFNARQKVVALHEKYDAVFEALRTKADALYNEMTTLGASIDSRTNQYNADVQQLSADIETFNNRANDGSFSSISEFNRERSALVARSNTIDADRASISGDIDIYNAKYTEYQEVTSQIEVLNKSIDSIKDLQPAPSV